MEKLALFWSGHEGRLDAMGGAVDALARAHGAWTVRRGRLDFARQSDLEAFRLRLSLVSAATASLQLARPTVLDANGGTMTARPPSRRRPG